MTPEKMAEYNMAHELGHIDQKARLGEGPFSIQRAEDMKGLWPVPNKDPGSLMSFLRTPKGIMYWRKNKAQFAAEGIHSRKELMVAQERSYKSTVTESYADDFAARVLARVEAAKAQQVIPETEAIQN